LCSAKIESFLFFRLSGMYIEPVREYFPSVFILHPVSEHDTLISKEYILEPDADFERAITMDELLQGVKADIHEMFKNKQKRG
jgi:hypothetical protein